MAFDASWESENVGHHTTFQTTDVRDVDSRVVRTVIGDLTDVEGQAVVGEDSPNDVPCQRYRFVDHLNGVRFELPAEESRATAVEEPVPGDRRSRGHRSVGRNRHSGPSHRDYLTLKLRKHVHGE